MLKTIGVIGAGQMGSGIAHVCALAEFDVKLTDVSREQLDKSLEGISANMDRQIKRSLIQDDDRAAALGRITTGDSMEILAGCDLVVEAATENEQVKVEIYKELCPHLPAA